MNLVQLVLPLILITLADSSLAANFGPEARFEETNWRAVPTGTAGQLWGVDHNPCTAFLVDVNIVVTAAHCLYRDDEGTRAESYRFRRAFTAEQAGLWQSDRGSRYDDTAQIIEIDPRYLECVKRNGGRKNECEPYDWALLKTNYSHHEDFVSRLLPFDQKRHFKIAPKKDSEGNLRGPLYMPQFPEDFKRTEGPFFGYTVFPFMLDRRLMIIGLTSIKFKSDAHTSEGSSGAPLLGWYTDDPTDNRIAVLGMHVSKCVEIHRGVTDSCFSSQIRMENFKLAVMKHVNPKFTQHLR